MSQNYSHYLQRKVHIKAVNIFDTSAQKMFILHDLYLFILKMYDIWYEQKRAVSLKVLFPLVWTFWLHLLWTINLPYYKLNCRTSINNFFELGTNWKYRNTVSRTENQTITKIISISINDTIQTTTSYNRSHSLQTFQIRQESQKLRESSPRW